MSRPLLQILAVLLVAALLGGGAFVMKQRRETERRQRQVADMRAALSTMRDAIGSFDAANGRPAASLEELVKYGQLTSVPVDPVTGSAGTWQLVTEERIAISEDFAAATSPAGPTTALIDVRSGAPGSDPAGKPWSSY